MRDRWDELLSILLADHPDPDAARWANEIEQAVKAKDATIASRENTIRALIKAISHVDRAALLHALKLHPHPVTASAAGAVSIMVLMEAGLFEQAGGRGFFHLTDDGLLAASAIVLFVGEFAVDGGDQ